uniref:TNFR-Cys domain-containing protein n=1 Tax=Lates calcarifer TaxID=8187 RepID=A0A4W6D4E8_LATCA
IVCHLDPQHYTLSFNRNIMHEIKLLIFFSTGSRVKTDCTEFRSTSCLPCLEGTYMNQPTGLKDCFPCTNCNTDPGLKIKTSCTSTSDTVCEPLEGFYCMDVKDKGCEAAQRHRHCEPGQYISKKGTASTDTECSDCTDGTFSNGTFTSCQHTPGFLLQSICSIYTFSCKNVPLSFQM